MKSLLNTKTIEQYLPIRIKKQILGTKLIRAFREEVEQLVKKKNFETIVTFINHSLEI